jgi:hypothetical protein
MYYLSSLKYSFHIGTLYDNNATNASDGYGRNVFRPAISVTPNRLFYNSAAPTVGTAAGNWAVGDRAINSVPTVGQPKAWVCTVAGAPGTWISEGNL